MNFSAADIPILSPNPFGHFFEQIRKNEPERGGLTPVQIADLVSQIDDVLGGAHSLLDNILQYDLNWRTSVFQGKTEYDEAFEKRIESELRFWAVATERLVAFLDGARSYGVYSESIENLRPRLAEVRGMLTPDNEFFEGDELDGLTAQAIAEDDGGKTVEFRTMGA